MGTSDVVRQLKHQAWLRGKYLRELAGAAQRHASPARRRVERRVRNQMSVPEVMPRSESRAPVWAVCLMRNEAELLPLWLRHCESQGIGGVVVGNNLSTDRTAEIVRTYDGGMPTVLVEDTEPKYYQEHKMDFLAQVARNHGAQWIVPMDADEFWYGARGTLTETLLATPRNVTSQVAKVHNVVRNEGGFWAGSQPDRLPKVAYRWHPLAHVDHGNHAVSRPGELRRDLRILHFSYRSLEHFVAKVRHGAQVLSYLGHDPATPGHSWLDLNEFSDEELADVYAEMLQGRGPEFMDWIPKGNMIPVEPFPWTTWGLN